MTDEEKANRHIKNNYIIFEDIMQVEYQLDSLREKDYLAGLAEGRKGKEELKNMASKQVDEILKLYDQIEKMKFDIKVEAERNAYISQATLNHLLEQWEKAE